MKKEIIIKKHKGCYTELFILNEDGTLNVKEKIFADLRNHIFRKDGEKGICENCGLILSKINPPKTIKK